MVFFVLFALPGNVDICKEANGCNSHPGRHGALCSDVNISNVNPVHSSAWISCTTNTTVNPFSLCVYVGVCVCLYYSERHASALLWVCLLYRQDTRSPCHCLTALPLPVVIPVHFLSKIPEVWHQTILLSTNNPSLLSSSFLHEIGY